eukprot:CAMPEP_0172159996 /NCGR_PEP_ID=MMETSP1050-20130122/5303_1 /TAXON_ID=233186 /ORGANISM="Cryptomonas curvata, Strain CCAP979/52" /LENGTH=119 /DNA_ID=CAMNT_0012829691 /DNA_START=568 /DNA_END=924 /DNA_ORIENTATION=-
MAFIWPLPVHKGLTAQVGDSTWDGERTSVSGNTPILPSPLALPPSRLALPPSPLALSAPRAWKVGAGGALNEAFHPRACGDSERGRGVQHPQCPPITARPGPARARPGPARAGSGPYES